MKIDSTWRKGKNVRICPGCGKNHPGITDSPICEYWVDKSARPAFDAIKPPGISILQAMGIAFTITLISTGILIALAAILGVVLN